MNPLILIRSDALNGKLPEDLDATYYASGAFRERLKLEGHAGEADKVAITTYLLGRLALSPLDVKFATDELATGHVALRYFGVVNPVGYFTLDRDSPHLEPLRQAVKRNIEGPMFKAAIRVRRWRTPRKHFVDRTRQHSLIKAYSDQFTWPAAMHRPFELSDVEMTELERLRDLVNTYSRRLYEHRLQRLGAFSEASTPGLSSWYELLHDIARFVLRPAEEPQPLETV